LQIGGVDYRPVDAGAYLPEDELPKLKQMFWRNNIVGFSPFLDVPVQIAPNPSNSAALTVPVTLIGTWVRHTLDIGGGETFQTGVLKTNPWWQIETGGRLVGEESAKDRTAECVVGQTLEQRNHMHTGDVIQVRAGQETASASCYRHRRDWRARGRRHSCAAGTRAAACRKTGQVPAE